MSKFRPAFVDTMPTLNPTINQNFGVKDLAYEVAQAIPGAKVMPHTEQWSWIYFEDDHFCLGMVGYGDFRAKGDGTFMYTVKSPSIKNGKYSDHSAQYHMAMSTDRTKAVKNARKYLRRISPVEATEYTKGYPREKISSHRGVLQKQIEEAEVEVFGRPLFGNPAIMSEMRVLVDTDYQFVDQSVGAKLRNIFNMRDERHQDSDGVNMTAVFLRNELGRQRADAVLVDKCDSWWPDVGQTHLTFYDHELPEHIMEKLAVLSMLEDQSYVHGVGMRINARMFYVTR